MDYVTAKATILDRFKDQWDILHPEISGVRDVPVAWPALPYDPGKLSHFNPASQTGWVRVTVLTGETRQASISGAHRRWRTPGVVIVNVFTRAGMGEKDGLEIADDVVSALQGVTVSGVVLQAASVEFIGTDETGAWTQHNVRTVFRFDALQS